MRAAVYHGAGDVRIETVDEPRAPGAADVILKVLRAGMCGTDAAEYTTGPHFVPLHARHAASGHVGPTILGHEFIGEVVARGKDVQHVREGQRVAAGAGVWCGRCGYCRAGRTNLCDSYFTLGLHTHGGFAEYVVAPAKMCQRVPDAVGDDAAALAQPLAIALHAVRHAELPAGATAAVIGVGGIGSFIVAAAADRGMAPVIAVDLDAERLATAGALGAAVLVKADEQDPLAAVLEATAGRGADIVIEASGTPEGLATAWRTVRRGGRVIIVGLQDAPREVDLFRLSLAEIDVRTTLAHVCDIDLPEAIEVLAEQDLRPVIDRVIPLERIVSEGLEPLAAGKVSGKPLVSPS